MNRTIYDPNEIIIKGNIAEIVLYNKKCEETARTIVDAEDVEKIKDYKWHLNTQGYAATNIKNTTLQMQHLVVDIKNNRQKKTDHEDRDRLNNRKTNIRFCTQKENARNRGKSKNNTSGHKGVSWNKNLNKWDVRITANQKQIFLGYFNSLRAAAKEYNNAAIKHFGKFAVLNEV